MRDVVVIGAGVIGLASALALLERGARVTLVDRAFDGHGASWGNAAHLATEQWWPLAAPGMLRRAIRGRFPHGPVAMPLRAARHWLPFGLAAVDAANAGRAAAAAEALGSLIRASVPAWQRVAALAGAADQIDMQGHLVVWERAKTAALGRAAWHERRPAWIGLADADEADLSALRALAPHAHIAAALRFTGTGQLRDPGAMLAALRSAVHARGGEFLAGSVDAVEPHPDGPILRIAGEPLCARQVLIAAGAASRPLLNGMSIAAPLIHERGYHLQAKGDAGTDRPIALGPVVFEDRGIIATHLSTGLRLAGITELVGPATPPDPAKWRWLQRHAVATGLPIGPDAGRWCGARPTFPDYLPAIGRVAGNPSILYACGHQHLGLTLAAITADLVAALATGMPPAVDLTPFAIERFAGG